MKQTLYDYLDSKKDEIIALGQQLFKNPELGYKEFETGKIIKEYLAAHQLQVHQTFAYTGFSVSIGNGKPHIGLIAELDAIPTLGHPCANLKDNAAHACGHSAQCTTMLAVIDCLNNTFNDFKGTITLFFTPAEEFTDVQYRKQLIKDGIIKYAGGKQQMIYEGIFDDVDCLIHLHASNNNDYHFSINTTLAGFIYKKITFKGKAAHAAMGPHQGVNALNMCNLFLNSIAYLRETFKEEDLVRVHGIISKGGDTVNSIPEEVIYECYVRTDNPNFLLELNQKVTNAAKCCALALNGEAVVEDTPGYMPLYPSKDLSDVIYRNALNFTSDKYIRWNEKSVAAGDVGDISCLKPITQYGYSGFEGRIHGRDLKIVDEEYVYLTQAKVIAGAVYDLLTQEGLVEQIVNNYKPKLTRQQYLEYLDKN